MAEELPPHHTAAATVRLFICRGLVLLKCREPLHLYASVIACLVEMSGAAVRPRQVYVVCGLLQRCHTLAQKRPCTKQMLTIGLNAREPRNCYLLVLSSLLAHIWLGCQRRESMHTLHTDTIMQVEGKASVNGT